MIEKLDLEKRHSFGTLDWLEHWNEPSGAKLIEEKINELVDAVNAIQKERESERFEIQEWIDILEAVRKSVNVHEKQIDELQMKTEPETRAKNVPEPIKLYVCPDGSMYDNEAVAKSHAASIFNPLPAGATTTDQVYLEQDPYAEQRKWIGKLCRFKDNDDDKWNYSVLKSIDTDTDFPFWDMEDYEWGMCEPVSPEDDIIYQKD